MSSLKNEICHNGRVTNIDDTTIYVVIVAKSACSSCHSKTMCSMTEMEEKIIEIKRNDTHNFQIGDKVEVKMNQSMGTKAVLLGYFIPFILMMITLIASYNITGNEAITGLLTIVVLVIYYFLLFIFKKQISKNFSFQIQ